MAKYSHILILVQCLSQCLSKWFIPRFTLLAFRRSMIECLNESYRVWPFISHSVSQCLIWSWQRFTSPLINRLVFETLNRFSHEWDSFISPLPNQTWVNESLWTCPRFIYRTFSRSVFVSVRFVPLAFSDRFSESFWSWMRFNVLTFSGSVIDSVNLFGYDHDSLFSCPAIESEYLFGHECDSLVSHSAGQCWSQLIFSIINAIQLAHIQRIQWIIIVMTTVLCSHVHVSVCHSDQEWYFHFYYYRSLYDLFGHDRDLLLTHSAGLWVSESF